MPAVEIERLSRQVKLVAEKFGTPYDLLPALRDLFETYADRTFRAPSVLHGAVTLPEYHLPPLLMPMLEKELGKICQANPFTSLEVIDLLWKEPYREPRLLASSLLGKIPISHASQVIDRLQLWAVSISDPGLAETIIKKGSQTLRSQAVDQWLEIIQAWLNSDNPVKNRLGLNSLTALIQDHAFADLPRAIALFIPFLRQIHPDNMPPLQKGIESLARRTPNETVYILKQEIATSPNPSLLRLLRRCLPAFPEEEQQSLRAALLSASLPGKVELDTK